MIERQKAEKSEPRQSNIELLRILAIIGVIILHCNHRDIGGGFKYVPIGSVNEWLLQILESLFVCAVDLFVLISGYFMCLSNKRCFIKPLQLIVQVIAFSVGQYLLCVILGNDIFSMRTMFRVLVPCNYFVILYATLYLISPYINLFFSELQVHQKKQCLFLLFLLFSIWPFLVDILKAISGSDLNGLSTIGMEGSQGGYTIVNFVLLYVIGTYIRLNQEAWIKNKITLLGLFLCVIILTLTIISRFNEDIAWEYCNPFVIAEAIVIFLIFLRIHINANKIINGLAKSSFSVFLLHSYLLPKEVINKVVQGSIWKMVGGYCVIAITIYLICFIIHKIYDKITAPIFRALSTVMTFSINLHN